MVEGGVTVRRVLGRISRAAVFASAAGCYTSAPPPQDPQPPPPPPPPVDTVQGDATFAKPPPGPTATGTASIHGYVRSGRNPISGVVVVLENLEGGAQQRAISGAAGEYEFTRLPPGRYGVALENGDAMEVQLIANQRVQRDIAIPVAEPYHHQAKPYGAPPARRRVV